MNISEEKEYLYGMMKLLLEERRLITEELLEIRTRVNKLNDFQEVGINDIPAVDYIRLKNSLNEKKYETARSAVKEAHDNYKEAMHYATPKNYEPVEQEPVREEPVQQSWEDITPKKEERISPIVTESKLSRGRKKPPSHERVKSLVISLLKDRGVPIDTKTIRTILEAELDFKFPGNTFSTHMWRIKKDSGRVSQPSRGFYQYK